jgi:NDP-sugar pyrophosphorylase family protein
MVLAAGRGTRLAPLTDERPKPLLPLGPLPLLHFPLLLLRAAGIREVMVNLHHLGSQIRDQIGDGKNLDLSIRYSEEHPTLLGTGGGIKRARAFLEGGTFVVMNGDTLVDADLPRVLEAHARSGATATMVLADALPGEPFGLVAVDAEMRIRELAGRLGWKGRAHRTGHFCGIHVIESRVFEAMPDRETFCINADLYPRLIAAGEPVLGCFLARSFSDVGTPERYLGTAEALLDGRLASAPLARTPGWGPADAAGGAAELRISRTARIDPSARIEGPVYIGPDARVEARAAVGPYALLGAGSRMGKGGRVNHAIVWEDASLPAQGTLERAILTPRQRVPVESTPAPSTE